MKKIMCLMILFFLAIGIRPIYANADLMIEVEGIVDGYVNEEVKDKVVVLTLTDNNYIFDEVYTSVGEDITEWFTNIPEGLKAEVTSYSENSLGVTVSGTTAAECDLQIKVKVPDGPIVTKDYASSVEGLENVESDKAKYIIEKRIPSAEYTGPFTVSGYVKEDLEVQYVYIRLINTKATEAMLNAKIDLYNGLTGKVVEISEDQILKVEYTGNPENEDHSLIDITLSKELVTCNEDLKVPDREDVKFDINPKTEPVIPDEPVTPDTPSEPSKPVYTHPIPQTGVE